MTDPTSLPIADGVAVPLAELEWQYSASGGPGGQHVNTSNTRVAVRFDIAGSPSLPPEARLLLVSRLGPSTQVVASDRRSQLRNRELALARLAERLHDALRVQPARRATRPTLGSQRRRLEAKRRQSERKQQRRGDWD